MSRMRTADATERRNVNVQTYSVYSDVSFIQSRVLRISYSCDCVQLYKDTLKFKHRLKRSETMRVARPAVFTRMRSTARARVLQADKALLVAILFIKRVHFDN